MNPEELENNIVEALNLAKNIYKIVNDPKFIKEFDEDARHKLLVKKYPNFANAYPVVLRLIARDIKYNEKAFKRFFDKLKSDPGKGMEGFIERQADYVKFLYIEDCKANHRHWSTKKANEIWKIEYQQMSDWVKKIKKQEEEAKNEFSEEEKRNFETKKKELLNFLNEENPTVDEEPKKSLGEININDLNKEELLLFILELRDYRLSLIEEYEEKFKDLNPEYDPREALQIDTIDLNESDLENIKNYTKDLKKESAKLEILLNNLNYYKKLEESVGVAESATSEKVIVESSEVEDNEWLKNTNCYKKKKN